MLLCYVRKISYKHYIFLVFRKRVLLRSPWLAWNLLGSPCLWTTGIGTMLKLCPFLFCFVLFCFKSSRTAWSMEWVPGQPGLHKETLSQKHKNNKTTQLWLGRGDGSVDKITCYLSLAIWVAPVISALLRREERLMGQRAWSTLWQERPSLIKVEGWKSSSDRHMNAVIVQACTIACTHTHKHKLLVEGMWKWLRR